MIEIKNLEKSFKTSYGTITALKDINLTVNDGEIFGIIGLSGAGKSTLVRCINLLERPTKGEVVLDGKSLTTLKKKELLKVRQTIGMIFQGFNLLEQRNVLKNVCYPLEIAGVKKADAEKKAKELIEMVGLSDRLLCFYSPLLHAQLIPQMPPLRLFSLLPVCNPAVLVLSFFKSPFSFSFSMPEK